MSEWDKRAHLLLLFLQSLETSIANRQVLTVYTSYDAEGCQLPVTLIPGFEQQSCHLFCLEGF